MNLPALAINLSIFVKISVVLKFRLCIINLKM